LRLFQLTPSHIEEALALVVSALVASAFIAVAFTVVQPYAVAWRSASVLLPSVLLLQEHTTRRAAGTIPTHRATKAFSESYRALVDRRAHHRGGAGVDCLAGYYEGAPGGSDRFQPATNDLRLGSKAPVLTIGRLLPLDPKRTNIFQRGPACRKRGNSGSRE